MVLEFCGIYLFLTKFRINISWWNNARVESSLHDLHGMLLFNVHI